MGTREKVRIAAADLIKMAPVETPAPVAGSAPVEMVNTYREYRRLRWLAKGVRAKDAREWAVWDADRLTAGWFATDPAAVKYDAWSRQLADAAWVAKFGVL